MAFYLDTSALVKLVVAERESAALTDFLLAENPVLVSSDLARTELRRAVRRAAPDRMDRAREVLATLTTEWSRTTTARPRVPEHSAPRLRTRLTHSPIPTPRGLQHPRSWIVELSTGGFDNAPHYWSSLRLRGWECR